METKRFDFPDGSWWVVRARFTHGMVRRVQEAMSDAHQPPTQLELARGNDALALAATTSWSYGTEIDNPTMDQVPEEYVQEVQRFLDGAIGASPLALAAGQSV